jgi:hypothetical protein
MIGEVPEEILRLISILRIKNLKQRCYRIQTMTTTTNEDIKEEEMKQTFSRGQKEFPDSQFIIWQTLHQRC